jgi:Ca2+-binding RTX toxin-like protein
MAFLSGFKVSLEQADLLGRASLAAFAGAPVPAGWTVVTPASLGLGATYRDGNYYKDGDTGASAIVLRQGNEFIVAFRGTDDGSDIASYPELYFGTYIDHFRPLLAALKAQAPAGAHFSFTGASLGGGATNNMAAIAQSDFGGTFKNSTFVAFASPNITNKSGILNLGVENDPVYKSVPNPIWAPQYQDYASSADNMVLANDEYVAGNGERDMAAHSDKDALTLFARFSKSAFYQDMSVDSVIVIAASDGLIQDKGAGRGSTGAFYLGRDDGHDRMTGRSGNDRLEGFAGNDTLNGGGGNDKLDGGEDDDTLTGGSGDDLFYYRAGYGRDVITDFAAGAGNIDEIVLAGLGVSSFAQAMALASDINGDTVFDFGGGDTLTLRGVAKAGLVAGDFVFLAAPPPPAGVTIKGTKFADIVDAATAPAGKPLPTDLADTINGLGGDDTIFALGGNDIVNGGAGADIIDAGDGDDTIMIAGGQAQFDAMSGGAGTDTLKISGSKVTLAGFDAAAASIEVVQASKATMAGNAADNVFDLSALASITGLAAVDGGNGNDTLIGSQFADTLRGANGNDTLTGGAGNDILTGGKGIDTFVFGPGFGHDRITDFAVKGAMQDVIQFDSTVFADFAAVMAHAAQAGKAVVITLDAGNSLTLNKITLASLTADDFLFV